MTADYDIAIAGSGFAGSLLAMIARRAGRSVLLLEKGAHPRFAIGESSTPLANLLFEDLAVRYDLPRLRPLAKWGTWQQSHPELACGLKRGFTFYHHTAGAPLDLSARDRQLLVAASPHDAISDTHWYRADFDRFLAEEAQALGADYLDRVTLKGLAESPDAISIEAERAGRPLTFRARFLIDASGPRGFLQRALGLREKNFPNLPHTQALYSHFSGVAHLGTPGPEAPPYPADDAALHHVFDGGWIWILRFNNGLVSAGAAVTDKLADRLRLSEGAASWSRLLDTLPTVRSQFAGSRAELPFVYAPHLSFLTETIAARRWAMLPSAAAFVDPLLSTGFPLTLLGVERLGDIITGHWDSPDFAVRISDYAARTEREALAAADLIGALYSSLDNFPLFTSLTLLYFAAASFAETARRLGKPKLASSFLLCDDPVFGPALRRLCAAARHVSTAADSDHLRAAVLAAIGPFNVAGLGNERRRNWYPVDAGDLLQSAGKLGATRQDIMSLLERSGFHSPPSGTV